MIHTIIYFGRYSLNIERLRSHHPPLCTFKRLNEERAEKAIAKRSKKVNGIVFGYMEKVGVPREDAFYAVAVRDIVLQNPLKLDPSRHTDGKGFAPSPSQFGDASARVLLEDIIQKIQPRRPSYGKYSGNSSVPRREHTVSVRWEHEIMKIICFVIGILALVWIYLSSTDTGVLIRGEKSEPGGVNIETTANVDMSQPFLSCEYMFFNDREPVMLIAPTKHFGRDSCPFLYRPKSKP